MANPKKSSLAGGLLALFCAQIAHVEVSHASDTQNIGDAASLPVLETLTTVGTRTERTLREVDASVSVKTADQLEEQLARDLEDLVRFEPGVSVGGTGSRFGLDGISIRGIGGNRVLTTLDGVRLPEEHSFGPFLSARRDYVDIDSLARADIARGPISSLYGSDALGGVVAFTSKKPIDYLQDGEPVHADFKAGYSSENNGKVATLTLAGGSELLSGLLVYTRRDAEETENQGVIDGTGAAREIADPQNISSDSLTATVIYRPTDLGQISLSANLYENDTSTQVLSYYGVVSRGVLTNSRDAEDTRDRSGITLGYEYEGQLAFSDFLSAKVYYQSSESEQITTDARISLAPQSQPQIRTRSSQFEQEILGAQLNITKSFESAFAEQSLSYGVDYYKTDNVSLRNGASVNAVTGQSVPEFFPFPTRGFPNTEVEQTALYLQNEILLADGKLRVTPGVRYDSFKADTTADEIYLSGNPGTPLPEDFEDSELTMKLGVVYEINENLSAYTRYSEGFRAPPYDDVNVGFTNFIARYKTISNADLKSETSDGYELGIRFQNPAGHLTAAAFKNDYKDFIQSQAFVGIDPNDGFTTFQSLNLDAVQIDGLELSGTLNLGELSERMQGVQLQGAIAYADGEDTNTGEPIESIEPLSGVFGLSYKNPANRWGGNLYLTLVESKDSNDIPAGSERIQTGGYALVDLMAHYQITDKIRVDAGIFNLTDKSYVRWADTAAIGNDAPNRFTHPGINSRITVRYEL